jgi:hypothetical protein
MDNVITDRATAAIEAAFDRAVEERFILWTANLQPGSVEDFVAGIYKMNSGRDSVIAELEKQRART